MDLYSIGVIPACIVWEIRKRFPSDDGEYVPFKYSEVTEEVYKYLLVIPQ